MTEHGPGITWLAGRVGCTPEDLLADPRRLAVALADAGRALCRLALDIRSDDAAVHADAEREAERLRRSFDAALTPGERFRTTVLGALRDATARVRTASADANGRPDTDDDHGGRNRDASSPSNEVPANDSRAASARTTATDARAPSSARRRA
ncbi:MULTISPECIES: hypothetical protein [unclassified Geodermatophilus]|uniref:hypothetical protein n=1 Tax=unclassified Geodermatophilus TaxID=2637632 RepID=UPI003EE8ED00